MDDSGDFRVSSLCYLHDVLSPPIAIPSSASPKDTFLLCVSGLSIGPSLSIRSQLLAGFVAAQLGFVEDVKLVSRIARVVLLGNSVALPREPFQHIRQDAKVIATVSTCVQNLDATLAQMLETAPVTVVPGATDATSCLVPQQPLHPSLFPRCIRYSSLECASNPYLAAIGGKEMLMTAGQNVADIARQVAPEVSTMEILERTLRWGCLFPTDPNTCRRSEERVIGSGRSI